jgi:diaminohydroxyphosphoribosylaminopyrimidine deaminase/5-amino-6-(5-phosphoribosylamino)uracil reductase
VDSRLETSPQARLFADGEVLVACAVNDPARRAALEVAGATVVVLPGANGKVDLAALMQELGRRQVNEVLAEAGFKLNGSLIAAGVIDELLVYLAPMLIGEATGMAHLPALAELAQARRLSFRDVRPVGEDIRILARWN